MDGRTRIYADVDRSIRREILDSVYRYNVYNEDSHKTGDLVSNRLYHRYYDIDNDIIDSTGEVRRKMVYRQDGISSKNNSIDRYYIKMNAANRYGMHTSRYSNGGGNITADKSSRRHKDIKLKEDKLMKHEMYYQKKCGDSGNRRGRNSIIHSIHKHNYTQFMQSINSMKHIDNKVAMNSIKSIDKSRGSRNVNVSMNSTTSIVHNDKGKDIKVIMNKTVNVNNQIKNIKQNNMNCSIYDSGMISKRYHINKNRSLVNFNSILRNKSIDNGVKNNEKKTNTPLVRANRSQSNIDRDLKDMMVNEHEDKIHMLMDEKQVDKMLRMISKKRTRIKVLARYQAYPTAYMNNI